MTTRTISISWAMSLLLSVATLPTLLPAQSIICVDTGLATFFPKIEYWKVDLNNCTDSLLDECLGYQSAFDITIRSDSFLFGYVVNNFPGDSVLFLDFIGSSGSSFLPGYINFDNQIKGLTCDENGFLYAAGKGITKVSSEWPDSQEAYLGDLPPGMECQGDITYRKGKFYVAAFGNKLVEVDMKNPANSQVVMEFPPGTLPVHGLATVQFDCDSVATYAVGRATSHSEVYLIDFDTWTLSLVCDLPERAITGAGSFTECMLPPCSVFVDLDGDNSSFGYLGNHCVDTFCISPIGIADTDVVVLSSPGFIDSITFQLTGITDGTAEFLLISGAMPNVQTLGNSTASLVLMNNGATIMDFEEALKAVEYINNAPMPTPGTRRVLVFAWANGEVSPLSIAELPLFNIAIQLQIDLIEPSCHGNSDGSIILSLGGGTPPYQYLWGNGEVTNLLGNLSEGEYSFTITDALGCGTTGSTVLGEPNVLTLSVENVGANTICNQTGALAAIPSGGTYPYTYTWDNGSIDSLNIGVGPGTYNITVQDANACSASFSTSIPSGDTVLHILPQFICLGESFTWQGMVFSEDTLACQVFEMLNGCDSTRCLALSVNPISEINIEVSGSLCENDEVVLEAGQHESYLWSTGEVTPNITVYAAGSYSVQVINIFGCIAEAAIEIQPDVAFETTKVSPGCGGDDNGTIEVTGMVEGSPPFAYSLNGSAFLPEIFFEGLSAGVYILTVMDANGCSESVTVALDAATEILLDAGEDQVINLGESIILTPSTNVLDPLVSWNPSDGLDMLNALKVAANPFESILYTLTVTDANGCSAQDEVQVTVMGISNNYVPSVFSPNGDDINDYFTVYADASLASIRSLRVFDRWGGLVFAATDILPNALESGWDGRWKGKPCAAGVYVFRAELLRVDGKMEQTEGEVLLLR